MDTTCQTPLTPDQLAAVAAGGGWARIEDPNTHRVYVIAEQAGPTETAAVDDEYIREKLAEAQLDSEQGRVAQWNLDEIKSEILRRLAENPPQH